MVLGKPGKGVDEFIPEYVVRNWICIVIKWVMMASEGVVGMGNNVMGVSKDTDRLVF